MGARQGEYRVRLAPRFGKTLGQRGVPSSGPLLVRRSRLPRLVQDGYCRHIPGRLDIVLPDAGTDAEAMRQETARIRQASHAGDLGEYSPNTGASAVPILAPSGKVLAARSLIFLVDHVNAAPIRDIVIQTAAATWRDLARPMSNWGNNSRRRAPAAGRDGALVLIVCIDRDEVALLCPSCA